MSRARDPRLRGLYAVSDAAGCARHGGLLAAVGLVLAGGARLVQYRDKSQEHARRRAEAEALLAACHARGALLIVNDDVELARVVGADGVHLGLDDTALDAARTWLGADTIIGATCHGSLELARRAAAAGADYLAFGSFAPSATKPEAAAAAPQILGAARQEFALPICAIGGIGPEAARDLVRSGADLVAASAGLWDAKDPAAAARLYVAAFDA